MKTGIDKVLGRKPNVITTYYNFTGKKDKDGKKITEALTLRDFTTSRPRNYNNV